jgi:hypothetical protein
MNTVHRRHEFTLCLQTELKGIKAKAQKFEDDIELWRGRFTGAPEYNSVIASRLAAWEQSEREENEKALKIMRSVSPPCIIPGSLPVNIDFRARSISERAAHVCGEHPISRRTNNNNLATVISHPSKIVHSGEHKRAERKRPARCGGGVRLYVHS